MQGAHLPQQDALNIDAAPHSASQAGLTVRLDVQAPSTHGT